MIILALLVSPGLACNSLAPAPVLPIYNQSCSWTNSPKVCHEKLGVLEQDQDPRRPWTAVQSLLKGLANCHCYQVELKQSSDIQVKSTSYLLERESTLKSTSAVGCILFAHSLRIEF